MTEPMIPLGRFRRRRRDVQSTVLQLFTERRAYLASRPPYDSKRRPTLGQAVIQISHQQAQAKGFQIASAREEADYRLPATDY